MKTGERGRHSKKHITFWYTDACNLRNKLDEFEGRLKIDRPDVIGITEVWMKEELKLDGYHPAICYSRQDRKGGGVLLFINEQFDILECDLGNDQFSEAAWAYISISKKEKLLVGVCYRPPNISEEVNKGLIDLLFQTRQRDAVPAIVMGDFNFPQINWDEGLVEGPLDSQQAEFYNATQQLYWQQNVHCHTRYRDGQTPSQLDLVFSSQNYVIDDMEMSDPIGKSDHVVLKWKYILKSSTDKNGPTYSGTRRRNFKRAKYDEILTSLNQVNWTQIQDMDVEGAWAFIKEQIDSHIEKNVPLQKPPRSRKPGKPWWNRKLTREVVKKYKLWNIYSRTKQQEDYQSYCTQRNKTIQAIREARANYEELISKNVKSNPKALYKYIRSQQRVKPQMNMLYDSDGKLSTYNR